jgi:hypothetical protein
MDATPSTLYPTARMDTYYNGSGADLNDPCAVRLTHERIYLEYVLDGERVVYEGRALSRGHYELTCEEWEGRATLHRIPGSVFLEGSWVEQGVHGMWRIQLGTPAAG